jgi:hypothetical protein
MTLKGTVVKIVESIIRGGKEDSKPPVWEDDKKEDK